MYVKSIALFSRWASRRLENWFQNSLKQLSAIQQKQVGLILGAAVADAAAHPWQGYTAEDILRWQQQEGQTSIHSMASSRTMNSAHKHPRMSKQYSMNSMDPNPFLYGLHHSAAPLYVGERQRAYNTEPFPRLLAGAEEDLHSSGVNTEMAPLAFADLSSFPLSGSSSVSNRETGEHLLFLPTQEASLENGEGEEEEEHDAMENLQYLFHSCSYSLFAATVRSMGRSHGHFFSYMEEVKASWVEEVQNMFDVKDQIHHVGVGASKGQNWVTQEHGTLLHALNALLAIPIQYPYASDNTLHEYSTPLLNFLLHVENGKGDNNVAVKHACVLIILSVLIRCLQSNPDPLRNTALLVAMRSQQAPFLPFENLLRTIKALDVSTPARQASGEVTQADKEKARATLRLIFPLDVQKSCFGLRDGEEPNGLECISLSVANEMQTVREALSIASKYSTASAAAYPAAAFVQAVEEAIGMGCGDANTILDNGRTSNSSHLQSEALREKQRSSNVCHRAMLVGAFLGAKFGVRAIPPRWLSATVDHAVLASMSVDIAQSSWNPDSG